MPDVEQHRSAHHAILRKSEGNPQGKGLNGLLLDWYRSEPRGVVAKPPRQLMAEFFTSMLVLSATFKYRPVVGSANYLYWINGKWCLSLIAPDEWSAERRDGFAGMCVLQADMTWTIVPSDLLAGENPVSDAMVRFHDAFADMLCTGLAFEEILPSYVHSLHYYQRLYASALSRSMRAAVRMGDQTSISGRQWSMLLPKGNDIFLTYRC